MTRINTNEDDAIDIPNTPLMRHCTECHITPPRLGYVTHDKFISPWRNSCISLGNLIKLRIDITWLWFARFAEIVLIRKTPCDMNWLDYGIPGHFTYMSLHKKATIVIFLVLQSTPTYVNKVTGYSIIAPYELYKQYYWMRFLWYPE